MSKAVLPNQCEIGVVGLDASGRRLVRALVDKRLSVAAFDHNADNLRELELLSSGATLQLAASVEDFMGLLRQFRTILITGPDRTGDAFREVVALMESGDLLLDAAECHFRDCVRRAQQLAERDIRYLGLSTMESSDEEVDSTLIIGGKMETHHSVYSYLTAIAPHKAGEPSVNHIGPAAAEHFIKMIRDGIECTVAVLAQETAELLKAILNCDETELRDFASLAQLGPVPQGLGNHPAHWAAQAAREFGCPAPTIEAAVGIRVLSALEIKNDIAHTPFRQPVEKFTDDWESVLDEMQGALHTAILIAYAQGLAALAAGSEQYRFDIDLKEALRLWKCCGNRVLLLDELLLALEATPHLENLLLDDELSEKVMWGQERLRHAVWRAGLRQIAAPALTASLDYLDGFRGAWLPVNLIQIPSARRTHALI